MTTIVICDGVVSEKSKGDHLKTTFRDVFGTKRGGCEEIECRGSCKNYMLPSIGNKCDFCGCYPTKHQKLDDSTMNFEEVISQTNADPSGDEKGMKENTASAVSLASNIADIVVYDVDTSTGALIPSLESILPLPARQSNLITSEIQKEVSCSVGTVQPPSPFEASTSSSSVVASAHCSTNETHSIDLQTSGLLPFVSEIPGFVSEMTRSQLYQLCVPFSLLAFIDQRTDKVFALSSEERQFILRWMVLCMENYKLTNHTDFVEVASLALKQHPQLESSVCTGVGELVTSMKMIKRNHSYYKSRKAKTLSRCNAEECNVDNIITRMQQEMSCPHPCLKTLKALLCACRKVRTISAKKDHLALHLRTFPALHLPELLFWEFQKQEGVNKTRNEFKMVWINLLPCLCQYFSRNKDVIPSSHSQDAATVELLRRMTTSSFFGPKRSSNKRSAKIIELFQKSTPFRQILPDLEDPPRLIAVEDSSKDNLKAFIYVDGRCMYSGSVVDCLIHLVTLYWVCSVQAAADVRGTIAFLSGVFLGEKAASNYKKYKSVIKALESLPDLISRV